MKLIKNIIFALILLIAAVFVAKDTIAKTAVENGVKIVTGLGLEVDKFHIGILDTLIDIDGMKIYNPKGFADKKMGSIPKIYVDYNLSNILKGKLHMEAIQINLEEFVVVKNADGKINVQEIKVLKQQQKKDAAPKEKPAKKAAKAPEINIDLFDLQIGKVIFKDYSRGGEPSIKEFKINLSERFENVKNVESIVSIILVKVMTSTTIGRLVDVDLSGLSSSVSGALSSSREIAEELMAGTQGQASKLAGLTSEEAKKVIEEAEDSVKEAAASAQETAQKTTASLMEKTKSLTGGLDKLKAAVNNN